MSFIEKTTISIIKQLMRTDKQKAKQLIEVAHSRRGTLAHLRAAVKKRQKEADFSFSQSGEDMVLSAFFQENYKGFYVDIGANHPLRFSNTYHFYLKGWRGLNIDAGPGFMRIFDQMRPGDINIGMAVGRQGTEEFFMFEESCYNTFDREIADEVMEKNLSRLSKTFQIKKLPLSEIMYNYLLEGQRIDFLSVDCEGLDLEILESNNWDRYRPEFICSECHDSFDNTQTGALGFLLGKGYRLVAKTKLSEIYRLLG